MKKFHAIAVTASLASMTLLASNAIAGKPAPEPEPVVPTQVTTVAPTGGNYTSPVAAMADLANWCGTPSSTNPCLLKLNPGVYDIGSSYVLLPPHVDMEGSGETVTRIKGLNTQEYVTEGGKDWIKGVVRLNGGNLRNLTVEATEDQMPSDWNDPYAIEIRETAKVENVTAVGHDEAYTIYAWMQNTNGQIVGSDLELNDVTVEMDGPSALGLPFQWATGIEVNRANRLQMNNVKVNISSGCFAETTNGNAELAACSSMTGIYVNAYENGVVMNSNVRSPQEGIETNPNRRLAIMNTQLDAPTPVASSTGGYTCVGVFDGAWSPVACQ